MQFAENMLDLIENSGFYFVPILCIMALFSLRELRNWRGKYCYFILSAVCLTTYLSFGGSSRYLLIGLLVCSLLAGTGSTMPVRYLHFTPYFNWLKNWHIMLLITLSAIGVCYFRVATRQHDVGVKEYATLFRHHDTPLVLCSVENAHGIKLAGLLREQSNIEALDFADWNSAMDFLSTCQYDKQEVFFFIRLSRSYTPEDFANWFRGKYSIYPFDTIKHSNGFLLIKFNGKTLDGAVSHPRSHALSYLPAELTAEKFRQWARIDIPRTLTVPPGYLIPDSGTADERCVYLRLIDGKTIPAQSRIALFNELCWREAFRDFTITTATSPETTPAESSLQADETAQINDNPPLILDPSPYFTCRQADRINWQNLTVLWRPESDRFSATQSSTSLEVKDIYLKQSANVPVQIVQQDLSILKTRPLKVLLLEEKYSQALNIAESLKPLLNHDSSLERVVLPDKAAGAVADSSSASLPDHAYDLVLVNIFADAFARSATIPLQADPMVSRSMNKLVKKLQNHYPEACIIFILPPPPPAGYTMYPLSNSPQLSRLAHYHITGAVERWYRRSQHSKVEILKLYLTLDPEKDYLRYTLSRPVWMGYQFTGEAQKHMAEDIGAFLVYKIQQKEL